MTVRALTGLLIWALATTAAAQESAGGSVPPGPPSKSEQSAIRSLVSELQKDTEVLRDYNDQHREAMARRPHEHAELAVWTESMDRLLRRMDAARAKLVETEQHLSSANIERLPFALGKDVANARREASDERTNAEHALAMKKPDKKGGAKPAKQPTRSSALAKP